MGNTIKKKRKIKNKKAEKTLPFYNPSSRATTPDDCLGEAERLDITILSVDTLNQTLEEMMSEVRNMVKKYEFKEEESVCDVKRKQPTSDIFRYLYPVQS